jgi:hypothetical protein
MITVAADHEIPHRSSETPDGGDLPVANWQERSSMSGFLGRRAVVVGAGIGGLSMAGALAKYFEQVRPSNAASSQTATACPP